LKHILWRIGSDTPAYEAHDLGGKGAERDGGRWNPAGLPVVYTSLTRALACLETVVHLNVSGLPLNRYLVEISVPADVWSRVQVLDPGALPVGWDAGPPGKVSIDLGAGWLKSRRSALLLVPSVIVPEEQNVLINPQHTDAGGITARKVRKWTYDPRLMKVS
jgi:RES domain-containing protein